MSLVHSPSIVRNGLVFYCDAGNTQKSWKGAPTTNLIAGTNVAAWGCQAGVVPTANAAFDPDGNKVATKIVMGSYAAGDAIGGGTSGVIGYTYTFSALMRADINVSAGISIGRASNNPSVSQAVSLTPQWQWAKVTYTLNTNTTLYTNFYGQNCTIYVCRPQLENLSYATPYTSGSRSNTQALLDLFGGKTITANSLTYASDNTFSFNGTTDYCTIASVLSGGVSTPFTLSAWAKSTNVSGWQTVIGTAGTLRQIGFSGSNFYYGGNGGGGNSFINGGAVSANTWCHMTFTFDGTTAYGYLNTVQTTGSIGSNGGTIGSNYLGNYSAGELLNGSIGLAMIYNRAITATENTLNFIATKGRFGL